MAQISVRVDDHDKNIAEEILNNIGISMSTAINMYIKAIGRTNGIPFELKADPFYSEKNMERLMKAKAQIDAGLGTEHEVLND